MSEKKGSSETDLFFIIESVTIFVEKMLEVIADDLTRTYSKSEWTKFKDLLTSTDLSPCTCFSYANSLKLTKQQQIQIPTAIQTLPSMPTPAINVASFTLGDVYQTSPSIVCLSNSSTNIPTPAQQQQQQQQQQSQQQKNQQKQQENNSNRANMNINPMERKSHVGLTSNPVIQQSGNNNNITINLINNGTSNHQNNRYDTTTSQQNLNHFANNNNNNNSNHPQGAYTSTLNFIGSSTMVDTSAVNPLLTASNSSSHNNNNNSNTSHTNNITNNSSSLNSGSSTIRGSGPSLRLPDSNPRVKSPVGHSLNTIHLPKQTLTNIAGAAGISTPLNASTSNGTAASSTAALFAKTSFSKSRGNLPSSNMGSSVSSHHNKSVVSPNKRVSITNMALDNKSTTSVLSRISQGSSYLSQSSSQHIKAQKSLQIDIKDPAAALLASKNNGSITTSNSNNQNNMSSNNLTVPTLGTIVNSARGEATPVKSIQFNSINSLTTSKNMSQAAASSSMSMQQKGLLFNSIQSPSNNNHLSLSHQQSYLQSQTSSTPNSPPIFSSINSTNRLIGVAGKPRESITTTTAITTSSLGTGSSISNIGGLMNKASILDSKNISLIAGNSSLPLDITPKKTVSIVSFQEQSIIGNVVAPGGQNEGDSANIATDQVPIRKRVRKETRKLSLEKFQQNIDSNAGDSGVGGGAGIGAGGNKKVPSKQFLDDLLGGGNTQSGKDKQNKKGERDPSPVNKRVGFEKLSEMQGSTQMMFKMDDFLAKEQPNPYTHLITQIKTRLDVFQKDTTTLQLISVKFVDIEQIKAAREEAAAAAAAGAANSSMTMNNSSRQQQQAGDSNSQQRGQVKRDNLKKYSVFAKKQEASVNFKRIDDQITKDEQQIKPNTVTKVNSKKNDEKKKLIM